MPTAAQKLLLLYPGRVIDPTPSIQLSVLTTTEDVALGGFTSEISTINKPGDWGTSTYTIESGGDPDSKFDIDGTTLENDGTFDFETATSHQVRITDTPSGPYDPIEQLFTISVTNVLEVTLAALTLDTSTIEEGSAEDTAVGALQNVTAGSSLSLTDSSGGQFKLSGSNIVAGAVPTDFETENDPTITVRETHADGNNSPRDSVIGITVTDGAAPETFIMDETTAGIAFAAYSLAAYLFEAYEGNPVCQLREDIGDTTQDFIIVGGVLVTDDVNEDTVADWLTANGASNAFVSILYDQSGNARNMVQATTGNQPIYAATGVNGFPAWRHVSSDFFASSGSWDVTGASGVAVFAAVARSGLNGITTQAVYNDPNASTFGVGYAPTTGNYRIQRDTGVLVDSAGASDTGPHVVSWIVNTTNGAYINEDGVEVAADGTGDIDYRDGTHHVGRHGSAGASYFTGYLSTLIIHNGIYSGADEGIIEDGLADLYEIGAWAALREYGCPSRFYGCASFRSKS